MKWRDNLGWLIKFDDRALKSLSKLDRQTAKRITIFLRERVSVLENPRTIGGSLSGKDMGTYWKYRVGDYRIVADIDDGTVTILVVKIGHRREVYRQ